MILHKEIRFSGTYVANKANNMMKLLFLGYLCSTEKGLSCDANYVLVTLVRIDWITCAFARDEAKKLVFYIGTGSSRNCGNSRIFTQKYWRLNNSFKDSDDDIQFN